MKINVKKGFTLIELLVVVAIIGILASIILATVSSVRAKGRDAKRVSDLKQIQNALELYFSDNGRYPNIFSGPGSSYCSALTSAPANWLPVKYISTISSDPSWNGNVASPNMPYTYEYCQDHITGFYDSQTYALWAKIESGNGNISGTWTSGYRPSGYNYVLTNFGPE